MDTIPDTQSTTTAPDGARPKAKVRQSPVIKFPCRFHCAISLAMADSLRRLTGANSLLSESDIGRLALHSYLLANDGQYARIMMGNSNGAR
jgi:hypothetical protein